jgi:hypothetical protein
MDISVAYKIPDMKHFASLSSGRLFQNGKYHNAGWDFGRNLRMPVFPGVTESGLRRTSKGALTKRRKI